MENCTGSIRLPHGWVWTTIKQLGEAVTGTTPSKSQPKYYGKDYPLYKPSDLNNGFHVRGADDGLSIEGIEQARLLPAKSILVTCIGATIGKTGFIRVEGASNQQINTIIPATDISPEYVYFGCISPQFQAEIISNASSTTLPILNKSKFESLPFPLPPYAEQQRIVAKIEELFTKLDAGVASLKIAKKQLKRYRQSVLKAAVEGELTREWREKHKDELEPASVLLERILKERRAKWEADQLVKMQAQGKPPKDDKWKAKYQEPAVPDLKSLPELPENWLWVSVEQAGDVSGGLTKNSKRDKLKVRLPYLRVANVYAGKLELDVIKDIGVEREEIQRILLSKGDLLIVEGNGSLDQIGRVALWNGSIDPCLHQNHLIKVRFDPIRIGEYVIYWLLSRGGRDFITRAASSTSGLHTLSLSKVASLPMPLPPLVEQEQITAEVERRFSVADEIEATLDAELKRAERLRQSILKRAFEGKLVPQDPNDEPASVLLERIKAEKVESKLQGKTPTPQKKT